VKARHASGLAFLLVSGSGCRGQATASARHRCPNENMLGGFQLGPEQESAGATLQEVTSYGRSESVQNWVLVTVNGQNTMFFVMDSDHEAQAASLLPSDSRRIGDKISWQTLRSYHVIEF
jgi:hypothetical protein